MKKLEYVWSALGCVIGFYVISYVILSVCGRFEPQVIGRNGVTGYAWAPKGFVREYRWCHPLLAGYYPLYMADTQLWHRSDAATGGKYPVDAVAPEDIGKVYGAWKQ